MPHNRSAAHRDASSDNLNYFIKRANKMERNDRRTGGSTGSGWSTQHTHTQTESRVGPNEWPNERMNGFPREIMPERGVQTMVKSTTSSTWISMFSWCNSHVFRMNLHGRTHTYQFNVVVADVAAADVVVIVVILAAVVLLLSVYSLWPIWLTKK